jgi:hypothetical protein
MWVEGRDLQALRAIAALRDDHEDRIERADASIRLPYLATRAVLLAGA